MTEAPWPQVPIREFAAINPKAFSKPPSDEDLVSFLPMPAIEGQSGKIDLSRTRPWKDVKKGFTRFQDGDVLFAKITPSMENGKITVARRLHGGRGAGTTELHVFRPTDALEPDYLRYYFLQESFLRRARAGMTGTAGQLRVPTAFIELELVPLAPRREQKRVVEAIEAQFTQLDAAVAALQRVRTNLMRYRTSVLKAACENRLNASGDPFPTVEAGASLSLQNGNAFKSSEWKTSGLPIIRIQNLNDPTADFNYFNGAIDSRFHVSPGDVLFAWSGTPGTSFGAHIWQGPPGLLNQHIFKVGYDATQFDSRFLVMAINNNLADYVKSAQGGVGLAHITKAKFNPSRLVCPEITRQRVVIAEVDRRLSVADHLWAEVEAGLQRCARMRQAILKKAFEGRLVSPEVVSLPPRKRSQN